MTWLHRSLFPRLVVKLGDERTSSTAPELMYTEVQEIEKVTGSSFAEWERELVPQQPTFAPVGSGG
jgi:hypothetical protein